MLPKKFEIILKNVCKYQNRVVSLIYQNRNTMATLIEAIADAKKIMEAKNLPFATIWKTGKSYGFNFEKKDVGYSVKECGVTRKVVAVI